jgi:hypothetical protein
MTWNPFNADGDQVYTSDQTVVGSAANQVLGASVGGLAAIGMAGGAALAYVSHRKRLALWLLAGAATSWAVSHYLVTNALAKVRL